MPPILVFVYLAGLTATSAVSIVNRTRDVSVGAAVAVHLIWPLALVVVLVWAVVTDLA